MANKFAINPMVNIWKFDNKLMATTDQNLFIEFDRDTLATKGSVPLASKRTHLIPPKLMPKKYLVFVLDLMPMAATFLTPGLHVQWGERGLEPGRR